ncbi:DUF6183 family protein [Nocardia asteroides]|uniref:DUF6183 family protein n=1 Tax=Nocardia asteroides TaxID=1824 RepID=UPI0034450BD4
MHAEIDRLVRELPQLTDFRPPNALIDDRVAVGDLEFVTALARAVVPTGNNGEHLADYSLRCLLASSAPGRISAALRVIAAMRPSHRRARRIAARLAGTLDLDDVLTAFAEAGLAGPIADELRACLLHELVLRDVAVNDHAVLRRWAASAHWSRHPLRALPLERTSFEQSLTLRHYGKNGSSVGLPFATDDTPALRRHTRLAIPRATETTHPAAVEQIEQAVDNWQRESNGRSESRTFTLSSFPDPTTAAVLLEALPLECLRARHPSATDLVVTATTPARAWSTLFAAAANGGAYNSGEGGAYGRIAAWRSLGGLCGATEFDSVDYIRRRAEDSHWFLFDADSAWFEHIAWDFAILVLTPEPGLSVLAVTDTD